MFTISQRPPFSALSCSHEAESSAHTTRRQHHPDIYMDIDDAEEAYQGSSKQDHVVGPGGIIASAKEYMRGHGTYVEDDQVVSSVAGTIQRVNKLISVKPLKSR